jgi:hypothetical protein
VEKKLTKLNQDEHFINNLWMSDEAQFHLNGFVNKQNFRNWSEVNPCQVHQRPLHSEKVTVWCAVSSNGIIDQYFFEDENDHATIVTSPCYVNMVATF